MPAFERHNLDGTGSIVTDVLHRGVDHPSVHHFVEPLSQHNPLGLKTLSFFNDDARCRIAETDYLFSLLTSPPENIANCLSNIFSVVCKPLAVEIGQARPLL